MNKEELIKNQFPNDEFLQSAVLRIVDKCTADLEEQLTKAKDLIELLLSDNRIMKAQFESEEQANIWFEHIHQAEQFLNCEEDK